MPRFRVRIPPLSVRRPACLLTSLLVAAFATAVPALAEEPPDPAPRVERTQPDPRDLRPLQIPLSPSRDSGQRLLDRSKIEGQQRRLERRGDPHNPRTQDRIRRLDRAGDRFR